VDRRAYHCDGNGHTMNATPYAQSLPPDVHGLSWTDHIGVALEPLAQGETGIRTSVNLVILPKDLGKRS